MRKIEFKPLEDNRLQSEKIIAYILKGADYFEYRLRVKPTVFISNDVLAVIAKYNRDTIVFSFDKFGLPTTICGYDLKVTFGENVLYLGVELPNIF